MLVDAKKGLVEKGLVVEVLVVASLVDVRKEKSILCLLMPNKTL